MDTRDGEFEGMQYLRQSQQQQLQDQTKTFDAKKWIWIPEQDKKGQEGFIPALVKSTQGDNCEVESQDGKVRLKRWRPHPLRNLELQSPNSLMSFLCAN